MEEKEILEVDIEDLKNAYDNIVLAMNDIKAVDNLDEEYAQLESIANSIENLRIKKEVRLEYLQEYELEEKE